MCFSGFALKAYISGVYGAKYVWVAPGWATSVFWLNAPQSVIDPCTQEQITSAVNSTLLFNGNPRRVQPDEVNFNGVVSTNQNGYIPRANTQWQT